MCLLLLAPFLVVAKYLKAVIVSCDFMVAVKSEHYDVDTRKEVEKFWKPVVREIDAKYYQDVSTSSALSILHLLMDTIFSHYLA